MSRTRTKRQFLGESGRWLLWIVAIGTIAITVANVRSNPAPPEQLPFTTVTVTPVPVTPSAVTEDDPGYNCMTQGNHVCGPGTNHPAGCYSGGVLVVPWTNYTNPRLDPLWGRVSAPC